MRWRVIFLTGSDKMQKVCDIADTVGGNIAADCRISAEETGVEAEIRGTFDIGNGIVPYHNN